jgi:hypothetical protein
MTEFSFPWSCTVSGDGGATSYSLAIVEDTNKFLNNLTPDTAGVIYWTQSPNAGLLEPTNPAGSTVRIASGVGIVEGWLYTNDANVDFDINAAPGNASATDIIVLQRVAASQTVRLARIGGAAGVKAVLTQNAATWEVPIADVVLDGAGNFSSLVDARVLAAPSGSLVKIAEFTGTASPVTFNNIPPFFSSLQITGRARGDTAAVSVVIEIILNNDAGANYDWIFLTGDSAAGIAETDAAADNSIDTVKISAANATANYFDGFEILIPMYSETTGYKNVLTQNTFYGDGTAFETTQGVGWWQNTAAITRVDLTLVAGSFVTGSKITLMGII